MHHSARAKGTHYSAGGAISRVPGVAECCSAPSNSYGYNCHVLNSLSPAEAEVAVDKRISELALPVARPPAALAGSSNMDMEAQTA